MSTNQQSRRTSVVKEVAVAAIVVVCVLVMGYAWLQLHLDAQWNSWVSSVWIARQPGATKDDVRKLLGEPNRISPAAEVSTGIGFLPQAVVPESAKSAMVYRSMFRLSHYWRTVIWLDANGKVVGASMGES